MRESKRRIIVLWFGSKVDPQACYLVEKRTAFIGSNHMGKALLLGTNFDGRPDFGDGLDKGIRFNSLC